MTIRWLDYETVGLLGPPVVLAWAEDDGPVQIHDVWRAPARDTLQLIEHLCAAALGGFHLSFDHFVNQKTYNVLDMLPPGKPPTKAGWLAVERDAVWGPCVKPVSAIDVLLLSQRGPMQSLMERDPIRVKRVPAVLAPLLAEELRSRVSFDGIYFTRRRDGYGWTVDARDSVEFPNVVLRFGAAGGLKPLTRHLLNREAMDLPVPEELMPDDKGFGWNPFRHNWVPLLEKHIDFWEKNPEAKRYHVADIVNCRDVWKHLGSPPPGDDDSILACLVGSSRWRGWAFDHQVMETIRGEARARLEEAPWALNPHEVRKRLRAAASSVEALAITSTKDIFLKRLAEDPDWNGTEVQRIARVVRKARSAKKEIDVADKLLSVGRGHFDFRVIGALSGRMSGTGGLSAHGIPSAKKGSRMRDAFTLADGELSVLDAGDFESFEPSIAAAVYKDAGLVADIKSGKKIHALFGAAVYDMAYADVKGNAELYGRSKNALLGRMYGAEQRKLAETLGLTEEEAAVGVARFEDKYPGVGAARQKVAEQFQSMRQPNGIGSRVEWHEPASSVDSLFGSKRFFTLENSTCRALFQLAESPPLEWRSGAFSKMRITRRAGRIQAPLGAVQSALFACAFGIQASNTRQAANHTIQASGASITKRLQCRIWDHQPAGVHPWRVQPFQIHDELEVPRAPDVDLRDTVKEVLEFYRPTIPLIDMKWSQGLKTWGEK